LAKGFIAVVDVEKLKQNSVARINKMDEERFYARYMDFYEHLYDQPLFSETYGLREDLSREEAVEKIKTLDKPRMYAIIDSLPDVVINNEFKRYLFKNKKQAPQGTDPNSFWNSIGAWIDTIKYLAQPKSP
jgi:hypothetical protein